MAFSNIGFSLTTNKYSLINVDGGDGEHIEFVEEKNDDYDFDLSAEASNFSIRLCCFCYSGI